MADEGLRELERAWRASPEDGELATRLVEALRRAGRAAPEEALDARLLPPRTLRASAPITVHAWVQGVALPAGTTADGQAVELPAHSGWEAQVALTGGEGTARLARELVELGVERVALDWPTSQPAEQARFLRALQGAPLTSLRLGRSGPVTAELLEAALAFPGLVRLQALLDGGLERLARHPALAALELGLGPSVVERDLEALGGLRGLESLELTDRFDRPRATGAFLRALPPRLRRLDLSGCTLTDDATLGLVARQRGLTSLRLPEKGGVSHVGVASLVGLPLRELALHGFRLGDEALRSLAGLPLVDLALTAGLATAEGLARLPASLEVLTLEQAPPFHVGRLARLRALSLTGRAELQGWLERLAGTGVVELALRSGDHDEPTALDPRPLALVEGLRDLVLDELRIDAPALAELGRSSGVQGLELTGRVFGEAHLEALSAFPRLTALALWYVTTSDRGLASLAACAGLRRLSVWGSDHSPDALARLRAARPDLVVLAR